MAAVQRHAAHAQALPDLAVLWREVFRREPGETPDVDENLYGGFVSNQDRRTLNRLRGLSAPALAAARESFDDPQLQRLLYRYRARNFPDSLSAEERQHWQQWCARKLHLGTPPGRTFAAFQQEIATLRDGADAQQLLILEQLQQWGEQLGAQLPPPA
ncbi:Exodeoxyribonuclease I [compost metagenome]